MISFRVIGTPSGSADLALVRSAIRLTRAPHGLWLTVPESGASALRRDLAFLGVRLVDDAAPPAPPGHVAAIGTALLPLEGLPLDVVAVRRMPLAESTGRVLGHRVMRLVPVVRRRRHAGCRALLREEDAHAWWERRAWLAAARLRTRDARATLRPIVFDRAALTGERRGGVLSARDGALTRWAFA